MFYFINTDEQLIRCLEQGACIHVLHNGQMMLSDDSSTRLDIIMVYDLVHKGLLRIAERNRIVLAEEGQGMTPLQIAGEIQGYLEQFEQDPSLNRELRSGPAFVRPKVRVVGPRIHIWYRSGLFGRPSKLTVKEARYYLARLRSGWVREHWWADEPGAYRREKPQ